MSALELIELIQHMASLGQNAVDLAAGVNEALKMINDKRYDDAVIEFIPNAASPQEARKQFIEARLLVWREF